MSTNILALPLYTFPMQVRTNEDWLDAWAYFDPATGNPIALDGLTLTLMVRPAQADKIADRLAALTASTAPTFNGLPVQGGIVPQGNVLGLSVLEAAVVRVLPGAYVFEVLAQGDGVSRVIAAGPLTVLQGVVR